MGSGRFSGLAVELATRPGFRELSLVGCRLLPIDATELRKRMGASRKLLVGGEGGGGVGTDGGGDEGLKWGEGGRGGAAVQTSVGRL